MSTPEAGHLVEATTVLIYDKIVDRTIKKIIPGDTGTIIQVILELEGTKFKSRHSSVYRVFWHRIENEMLVYGNTIKKL